MPSPAFSLVGGHPALDFVNTVDWRTDPARRAELLPAFDDLLAWAAAARVLPAAEMRALADAARRDPAGAGRALRRARRLRELLARLLAGAGRGARSAAGDLSRFNAFLSAALRQRRLAARGASFVWHWDRGRRSFDALLWPIVLAAAELLASDQRTRIRECGGPGCGWLFLDTSRSGRRRWCTMQSCGNRAKARRFYARTRDAAG